MRDTPIVCKLGTYLAQEHPANSRMDFLVVTPPNTSLGCGLTFVAYFIYYISGRSSLERL
jgi:hypothetical protein